jgi:hypothetical protein
MRTFPLLDAVNWKYAIGEFLLIVLGITFALAANSWYDNRRARVEELDYLRRIRASLEIDSDSVSRIESMIIDSVAQLEALKLHLEAGRPYSDNLDSSFAEIQFFRGVTLQTSIYESLRARGLSLISDDELQLALIDLFENHNEALDRQNSYTREIAFSQMQPYARQHFELDGQRAKPLDYQALLDDRYFLNLIESKVMAARTFKVPAYHAAGEAIRDVMERIDDMLED